MLTFHKLMVFYLLPRQLARGYVAGLTFLGMLFRRQFLGARNVQISIPAGCDHNCEFCITDIHGQGAPKHRATLSFEEICTLVDSALSICCLNLNLVSTGEPVLYPKLTDLIEYIYRKGRGRVKVKIVTNGTSLSKFSPKWMARRNVHLWLSLHAGDYAIWQSIHRPLASPEQKFSTLQTWLKEFNRQAPGRVTLHNVICKTNMHHLASVLDFAKTTDAREVFFGPLYRFPHLQLTGDEMKLVLSSLQELAPLFKVEGVKTNIQNFKFVVSAGEKESDSPDQVESLRPHGFYQQNNCYIPWLFSTVDDTGTVLACGAGRRLGSLRSHRYAEIISSQAAQLINETTRLKQTGSVVSGCRCQDCPHIQMNVEANRYLKYCSFDLV
jgi:wyosine [tRNA(Phe)-imidazoG37] synthetase (radical SAM superfamily)